MNGTAGFHKFALSTANTNLTNFVILLFTTTTCTCGIFRKVGILPSATIFVGLAVAYDLGILGLHVLLTFGLCEQNEVLHCVPQKQNIRILFNPFLCHDRVDPGLPFRLGKPHFTQQILRCGFAFRVVFNVHDVGHAVLELFAP